MQFPVEKDLVSEFQDN